MVYRTQILVPGLVIAALVMGCSSGDPRPETDGDDDTTVVEERYGALSAQYVTPRSWGDDGVGVQAQFLDARGVAVESALDALEVWSPRRGLALGECQRGASQTRSTTPGYEPVSLHLLDLGPIAIESPHGRVELEPRQLPDLLNSFYGVVYGSEWNDNADDSFVDYLPGASYRFSAPGTSDAGGFDVKVEAPEPLVLAAVNGEQIRDQISIPIDREQGLELVWETAITSASGGEVYLDLSMGYGSERARIQCRAEDEGAFSISRSMLRELSEYGERVELTARRIERSQTSIDGLDTVDVYFTTVDRVELLLE